VWRGRRVSGTVLQVTNHMATCTHSNRIAA
jgi:hypothetical protein